MIRRTLAGLAAFALSATPLAAAPPNGPRPAAATAPVAEDDSLATLGKMFKAEPLTPEQQALLPQAERIVALVIPEGTMSEMMGSMFEKMLGPLLAQTEKPGLSTITKATGLPAGSLRLDQAQIDELAAVFDPAYAERHKRELALMPEMMKGMMASMEPTMRKAMSELYAIHFTAAELNDVAAFFETPSGAAYARKSFTMSSDPRIVAATLESLPQIMAGFAAMEEKVKAATADLPEQRAFADLTPAEKAKVARLTGSSVKAIEAALADK